MRQHFTWQWQDSYKVYPRLKLVQNLPDQPRPAPCRRPFLVGTRCLHHSRLHSEPVTIFAYLLDLLTFQGCERKIYRMILKFEETFAEKKIKYVLASLVRSSSTFITFSLI
jgi:hypothetical protein